MVSVAGVIVLTAAFLAVAAFTYIWIKFNRYADAVQEVVDRALHEIDIQCAKMDDAEAIMYLLSRDEMFSVWLETAHTSAMKAEDLDQWKQDQIEYLIS